MSEEIQKAEVIPASSIHFPRPVAGEGASVAAVQIESERAIAEAQGQLVLAKRFPRDMNAAYRELLEACANRALAEAAFYSVPNRGQGPSIRLAEEIARVYGNFEYGHRELSRTDDRSEVEVYAWDKEKNNRSVRHITVMHTRDTKEGQKKLRDQKDIDDKIANVAAKQMRGRILALVPKWFSEAAQDACRKTLSGKSDKTVEQRVRDMVAAFQKWGVTIPLIEERIGHKLDAATTDDLIDLTAVYNSLKEGARVGDYFGASAAEDPAPKPANSLKDKLAAKKAETEKRSPGRPPKAAPAAPEAAPETEPEQDDFLPADEGDVTV